MQSTKQNSLIDEVESGIGNAVGYWSIPCQLKVIYGDSQNNVLSGNANMIEYIMGRDGDDIIYGGNGDILCGESGNDVLVGSAGRNEFDGGAGFDTIVINDLAVGGHDTITKFHAAEDKIHLDSSQFRGLNKGVLSEDLFYIGEKGTGNWHPGAEHRFVYDKTQLYLDYRTDDGTVIHLAKLSNEWNSPDLSHLNFFIV